VLAAKAAAPDAAVMLDVNCAWTPPVARGKAAAMAGEGLLWLEEPVWPPEDTAGLASLRRYGIPLSAGENTAGLFGFRALIEAGAIDVAQPSVTKVGGIGEMKRVIALAQAHGVEVVPHSPYFGPGFVATLHLAAALIERPIIEVLWLDMEANPFDPGSARRAGRSRCRARRASAATPIPLSSRATPRRRPRAPRRRMSHEGRHGPSEACPSCHWPGRPARTRPDRTLRLLVSDLYTERLASEDGELLVPERHVRDFTSNHDQVRHLERRSCRRRSTRSPIEQESGGRAMKVTRRALSLGGAGLAATASGIARPAIAQSEPIRVGWLAALTGPSSAPAIGFDRGVHHAVDAINAAGGVRGRKIELIVRDTQGDPTKAVNAAQEMISRARVHAIGGRRTPASRWPRPPSWRAPRCPTSTPASSTASSIRSSTPTPSAWRPRTARSTTR
jgi:hypothetical protein